MSDTLVIDSAQIARWQVQQDFDYNRELVGEGMTFTEWLKAQLHELFEELFDQAWQSEYTWWLLTIVGVVVVGVVVWYLWRYHPGLFTQVDDTQQAYEDTEDTIYGIDFDTAIISAVGHEDYREAVRLVYLKTLKALTDARLIDWQPYKTPSQYVRELSSCPVGSDTATANSAFRTLTAHFLRVRYGNYQATHLLYDEVEQLRKEVHHEP